MKPAEPARAVTPGRLATLGVLAAVLAGQRWIGSSQQFLAQGGVIVAIAAAGLGIVYGRCRLVPLCQYSFMAVGAWACAWATNVQHLGFWAGAALGIVATVPFGVLLGAVSLRLRGVYLAVATIGFAQATTVVLTQTQFPGATAGLNVGRPALFGTDLSFLVLCEIALAACLILVWAADRRGLGARWFAVGRSERGAAAAGVNVVAARMSAFVVSSAFAGLAGTLLIAQSGQIGVGSVSALQSLELFAACVLVGAQRWDGVIAVGVVSVLLPEVLTHLGIPAELGAVLFAVGAVAVLKGGEDGLHGRFHRRRVARARRLGGPPPGSGEPPAEAAGPPSGHGASAAAGAVAPGSAAEGTQASAGEGGLMLEASGLTVRYGNLVALSGVDVSVREGEVLGIIGPNGAGKSSLIDALTGFVRGHGGTVTLGGSPLTGAPPSRRARAGLRRTFQTSRISPAVTVREYLRMTAGTGLAPAGEAMAGLLTGIPLDALVGTLDTATQRLVEVAGAVAAAPRVICLDEPAAGLGPDGTGALAAAIRRIPATSSSAVMVVEHDMSFVAAACDRVVVLDRGVLLRDGPPGAVLRDPAVVAAYLGETRKQVVPGD